MSKDKSHHINGKWISSMGQQFSSVNPATEQEIWKGNEATAKEINDAIEAAKTALIEWKNFPITTRIKYLENFREILSSKKNDFAKAISEETGKPLWDSYSEVAAMINKVAISVEAYNMRCPELLNQQSHALSITRYRPHGILAVLGPFNFPGHLPNGHIIPALLAGNTIIFKPSELTPYVAELTVKCWQDSKLPKGVLNLIQGGSETGKLLSANTEIDGLLFTGSWKTGHRLAEQFAIHPQKILALEMGGNNPLVVRDISDHKTAAYLTIQSAYLSSGQRCTCARRLIVQTGKKGDAFLKELLTMIKSMRVGAYTDDPEPFMGPVISIAAANSIIKAQQELINRGGHPLIEISRLARGQTFLTPGLIDVTNISNRQDEEIFGPLLQVIRVNNFEEAITEANRTQYGLTAGLLSNHEEDYRYFYKNVRAGVINWNTQLTGASSRAPFGGIGKSGNNRPSAFYAADYCVYPIASLEANLLTMPTTFTPGITI